MPTGPYLIRRGQTFSFRSRVPADLCSKLGRREIVRAIGSGEPRVARLVSAAIGIRLGDLWKRVRMAEAEADYGKLIEGWFKGELDRVWRQFSTGELGNALAPPEADADERRAAGFRMLSDDAEATLERIAEEHAKGDYWRALPIARAIVARLPEPFDEADQRFAILSRAILEGLGEVQEARRRWGDGEIDYAPSYPPAKPVAVREAVADAGQNQAEQADDDSPTLVEAIETYLDLRKRERNPTLKQLGQLRSQLMHLVDALGAETKITRITRADAGRVFEGLRFLPSEHQSHAELVGLSFFDAVQKARKLGLPARHPKTINNYLTSYRGLFDTLTKLGNSITENPFKGMTLDVPDDGESERAFEDNELVAILKSPVFMGCLREQRPFDSGDMLLNEKRFWAPLIALMTGARVGEIAQLTPADIRQVDGFWVFDFNQEGDKRLKTPSSRRRVPIHSELKRLGILGFAKSQEERGEKLLLGGSLPKNGNAGQPLGNWFRERFLPAALPAKRPGTGWHSFRHALENGLRAAGIRDDVGNRITGHSTPGVAAKYGKYDMKVLSEALETVQFPAELKAIKPRA